jgi:hypothetical protein
VNIGVGGWVSTEDLAEELGMGDPVSSSTGDSDAIGVGGTSDMVGAKGTAPKANTGGSWTGGVILGSGCSNAVTEDWDEPAATLILLGLENKNGKVAIGGSFALVRSC